ncbi:MAG TPA: hypothetical protein DDW49_06485 [Deltaproteobacteria bacterium]|nr:hypothetical protein [Deltaproteobacteria bacterium]
MQSNIRRKNFYLNQAKLDRAQKILGVATATEAIDKALDLVAFQKEALQSLRKVKGKGKGHVTSL